MRTSNKLWTGVALVVMATSITACSGDKDGDDAAPLTLDQLVFGERTTEDSRDQDEQMQEHIATCMKEQGWEYTPIQYPDEWYSFGGVTDEDERERVAREGNGNVYSILYPYGEDGEGGSSFVSFEYTDPNDEYINSLSDAERNSYWGALYGTEDEQAQTRTVETDPDTGETYYMQDSWGAGCSGSAQEAVYGKQNFQMDIWELLDPIYTEIYDRIAADGRTIEATKTYVACMNGKGYEYDSVEEYYTNLGPAMEEEIKTILGRDPWNYDPFEGMSPEQVNAFFESLTEQEIGELYSPKLSDSEREQLEQLLERDRAASLANHDCSVPLNKVSEKVYLEHEAAVIKDRQSEIDAIAAQAKKSQ